MKKTLKRLLALTLTLLMLLPAVALGAEAANIIDLPIVYVAGKYAEIWNRDETQLLYPLDPPIAQTIKDEGTSIWLAFQAANNGLSSWKACADKIYNAIAPRYEPLVMDDNGNPRNGTHTKALEMPRNYAKERGSGYWLHDYMFTYDSRLDPYENARLLNIYINNILTVTGKPQVQLIGRCLGTTVVATYLTEYGCSKVKTCIFYAAAFNGVYVMDGFFSSDFDINYSRVQYYLKNGKSDEGGNFEAIQSAADGLNKLGLFEWFLSSANDGLRNMQQYLFPRLTLAIFGTWPGHWAMVSKDAFQKAKETTLADSAKYDGLIKKVKYYQDNVMAKFPQTLETCRQKGMRIAIVCKYNLPLPPLSPNSSMMADGTVELKTMSLGATAKNVGEMFTQSEINEIKESPTMGSFVATMRNKGKTIILDPGTNTMIARRTYLSNDNMVDASTCQYPDYTWFIKNCPHAAYPSEINDLFLQIFRSPTQYTIRTNEKYPQFVAFDSSTGLISEVSVTNPSEPEKPTSSSSFFKSIADWIIEFCRKIMVFFGMQ